MSTMNLTLLTDLYELTMMQGYFKNNCNETVVFDMFYRNNPCGNGYAICAGLDQLIDYIKRLEFSDEDIAYLDSLHLFEDDFLEYLRDFHFSGDIYAIPEGTVIFPREPLVKVVAPIMEAQLVYTAESRAILGSNHVGTHTPGINAASLRLQTGDQVFIQVTGG